MPEIETLTEEERARLEWELETNDDFVSKTLSAKLLRLHDALQARVKELESRIDDADGLACRWHNLDPEGGYSAIRVALGTECELCGGDNPRGHACTVSG
jgi:hypothetical protein